MSEYKGLPIVSAQYPLDSQALDMLHKRFHDYIGIYPSTLVVRVALKCTRLRIENIAQSMSMFGNKLQKQADSWLRKNGVAAGCKVSSVWSPTPDGKIFVGLWLNLEAFSHLSQTKTITTIKDWVIKSWACAMLSWPDQIGYLVKYPKKDSFIAIVPGNSLYRERIHLAFYHLSSLAKQMKNSQGKLVSGFQFSRGYTTWFGYRRTANYFRCKRGNIMISPY